MNCYFGSVSSYLPYLLILEVQGPSEPWLYATSPSSRLGLWDLCLIWPTRTSRMNVTTHSQRTFCCQDFYNSVYLQWAVSGFKKSNEEVQWKYHWVGNYCMMTKEGGECFQPLLLHSASPPTNCIILNFNISCVQNQTLHQCGTRQEEKKRL